MQWKKAAIDDLRRYRYLTISLDNIPRRIEAIDNELQAIKSARLDNSPVMGGIYNPAEERLITLLEEKSRLEMLYKTDKMLIDTIEKGLAALDATERLVLDRFFINRPRNHVEGLMEELGYERTQIYKIKDQALYNFTLAEYGITEL